jgi:hypothetical protein
MPGVLSGWRAIALSIAPAAAATLACAFAAIPLLEAVGSFGAGVVLVLVLAGGLHAVVGFFVPRPGWAMTAPGPVIVGWLTWALWADLNARPGDGVEATGGPSLAVLFAVLGAGLGTAMAGFLLLGAAARRGRDGRRAAATRGGLPPHP